MGQSVYHWVIIYSETRNVVIKCTWEELIRDHISSSETPIAIVRVPSW